MKRAIKTRFVRDEFFFITFKHSDWHRIGAKPIAFNLSGSIKANKSWTWPPPNFVHRSTLMIALSYATLLMFIFNRSHWPILPERSSKVTTYFTHSPAVVDYTFVLTLDRVVECTALDCDGGGDIVHYSAEFMIFFFLCPHDDMSMIWSW